MYWISSNSIFSLQKKTNCGLLFTNRPIAKALIRALPHAWSLGDLRSGRGGGCPSGSNLQHLGLTAIVDSKVESRLQQVIAHGQAHAAQADEPYLVGHCYPLGTHEVA